MFLIFDTETTGLALNYNLDYTHADNWPRLVQLAWQLHDVDGSLISAENYIIKPDGFEIPYSATQIHGISDERAHKDGLPLAEVLAHFTKDLAKSKYNVGHNIEFDVNVVGCEYFRLGKNPAPVAALEQIDTKLVATDFCAIPGGRGGKFKWPTLTELHTKLFGKGFGDAHDAAYDVDATARCFFGLIANRVLVPKEIKDASSVTYEAPKLAEANFAQDTVKEAASDVLDTVENVDVEHLEHIEFTHLHTHTQFSILQSTTDVNALVDTAKNFGMKAIAITDQGNMMGAFQFNTKCLQEDILPIIGCEFNVCRDHKAKESKDTGTHVVCLAKNKNGYHNLAKMASIAYTQGFYYVPRIDKAVIEQYKEDIIVLTGGLWGDIPSAILNEGEAIAEEKLLWWKEQFGDDFYIELNRHDIEEEKYVNKVLLQFAEKHNIKYVAANNTFYTVKEDADAHDILICLKDGKLKSQEKKYYGKTGREFRFGFPNDSFYLKSGTEMKQLFADLPDALENTKEIVDKIESYKLAREVLLPKFDIPEEFQDAEDENDGGKRGENKFLRHLTYEGAKKRYGDLTTDIKERLDFELKTIENTGYPGYFLIVQDFCTAARNMNVSVGPGRGSAAGSAVAYSIGITNIDPIKYDLLFERFLNPDRVSLPDIDIDFDDEGRQSVIDYVINKYGANQVAQIITYGTMAAKSSIKDTARVLDLPLAESNALAALIPDTSLDKLFKMDEETMKAKLKSDQIPAAKELIAINDEDSLKGRTVQMARLLEGTVRNTGTHACGVIITPDDITNFVPVSLVKDSNMFCTQFDNSVVEDAGLLKMDFLGLKTLTLIKKACEIVEKRHGLKLDPDNFPLDDVKTYELFQRGETVGVFQYESPGMQKHLKDLKPTEFSDLIAMNALYRPGPMEYIPSFVKRKHGLEPIVYDLDGMQEYLEETYGITVYQEQVMLLSQKLADFTKGEADVLRKAMGKKQIAVLEKMKPKFIEQAQAKGHDPQVLEKVWKDWEAFASYAFNKSHSTCYAWVAYQTAYLKAHYPSEYMASVLSNNMKDIKQLTFFMEEAKRRKIEVLGPDVNESEHDFTVNQEGQIRVGMSAIKGAGAAAIDTIVLERTKGGNYLDINNFFERLDYKSVNKKTLEGLIFAGGLDRFNLTRSTYFEENPNYLEQMVKFGQGMQSAKDAPPDLFGDSIEVQINTPFAPESEPWSRLKELSKEKEVIGLYLTGHPLDEYKFEIQSFCKRKLNELENLESVKNQSLSLAGMITACSESTDKRGNPFGRFTLEDYDGSYNFMLFRDEYIKFKSYLVTGTFVNLEVKVEVSKWRENQCDVKIKSIGYLSELLEKKVKSVTISVEASRLDELFVNELLVAVGIDEEHEKTGPLMIEIKTDQGHVITTKASKHKVGLASSVLERLAALPDLSLRLN